MSEFDTTAELTPVALTPETLSPLTLGEFNAFVAQHPELIEKLLKANAYKLATAFEAEATNDRNARALPTAGIPKSYVSGFRRYKESKGPFCTDPTILSERELVIGKPETPRHIAEISFELQNDDESTGFRPRLSFVFSTDAQTGQRYANSFSPLPANPSHLQFEGLFVGKIEQMPHTPIAEIDPDLGITVPIETFTALSELMHMPEQPCTEAIAVLQHLAEERQIDPQVIALLSTAIQDYAIYVKPEPITDDQCFAEIGTCMSVPYSFKQFCKEWVNVDISTGEYASYSGGYANFYHMVNTLGDIIIDWTAKQYRTDRDKPYPLVYENGSQTVRASWGPLGTKRLP
jgi:hypothetical protein